MRGSKPVAKIVSIAQPSAAKRTLAGSYRGKVCWTEGAFDPMTDEELIECGWGYMVDAPLLPPVEPEK
jgi:hypothetical protein